MGGRVTKVSGRSHVLNRILSGSPVAARSGGRYSPGGPSSPQMQVHFGEFVLDSETRELLRAGRPVHLSPKAFQLLGALVEGRPKALS